MVRVASHASYLYILALDISEKNKKLIEIESKEMMERANLLQIQNNGIIQV